MKRWKFFQVIFGMLMAGFVGDYASTIYGVSHVPGFEQNPLINWSLNHIGGFTWALLFMFIFLLGSATYVSCEYINKHRPSHFKWIIPLLSIVTFFRLVVVFSNVYGLMTR